MKKNKNTRLRDKLSSIREGLTEESLKSALNLSAGVEGVDGDGSKIKGEQVLWRAVITQALMDAGSESKKKDAKFERAQAIAWLGSAGGDFSSVCLMAGLDPSYVKSKARAAIARGCAWRKDEIKEKKRQRRLASNSNTGKDAESSGNRNEVKISTYG